MTGSAWPQLMRAATAARYVDEPSAQSFRRRVGKVYPLPVHVVGRGDLWRKNELDLYLASLRHPQEVVVDIADVL